MLYSAADPDACELLPYQVTSVWGLYDNLNNVPWWSFVFCELHHLIHIPMTAEQSDTFIYMNRMIKINMIWLSMDSRPLSGLSFCNNPSTPQLWTVCLHYTMAIHAVLSLNDGIFECLDFSTPEWQ